jgi:hypothetical protein
MRVMSHICSSECARRIKLDAAMAALDESSRLLSAFAFSGPAVQIEACFAHLQAAKSRLFEAIDNYRAHLRDSSRPIA